MQCGIVGLPNVGKSTIFNVVTQSQAAEAQNYPFCTIEPNVGKVAVVDERLNNLAKLAGSAQVIFTQIEFVDIAGLVRDASKGEGLGNQFLSHIREVDAIVHVLRCFDDENVTHVENRIDPIADAEIINIELMLSDLESLERRMPQLEKKAKSNKELQVELALMQKACTVLKSGRPVREMLNEYTLAELNQLQLITSKPVLYLCNVSEDDVVHGNDFTAKVASLAKQQNAGIAIISAKIESEIALLETQEEKKEFLDALGLETSGLNRFIKSCYELLGLITYFTIGPKEARAWTVKQGALAPQAAGVIHTDFEKGFIRAETIAYADYIKYGTEVKVKEAGRLRLEGKEYVVCDGDVMHFRFNV